MRTTPRGYKREVYNQLISLFWTIVGFAPVLVFWLNNGIDWYFYLSMSLSVIAAILPNKMLGLFMLSPNPAFYERLGVKHIRKLVQNGDAVKAMSGPLQQAVVKGASGAKRYLGTIAMYERFHWGCLIFFLLTAVDCWRNGYLMLGLFVMAANVLYNIGAILLQQYNKIRIKRMMRIREQR